MTCDSCLNKPAFKGCMEFEGGWLCKSLLFFLLETKVAGVTLVDPGIGSGGALKRGNLESRNEIVVNFVSKSCTPMGGRVATDSL